MKQTNFSIIDSLPWEEIMKISNKKRLNKKYSKREKEIFYFASRGENRDILIENALITLQKTEPSNATSLNAEKYADIMQRYAQRIIKEIENSEA